MDPQPTTPQPITTPSPERHSGLSRIGFIIPLFSFILLLLLGATAYLAYQNMQLQKQITAFQSTTMIPTPTPTNEPTANWKTYTTIDNLLTFKAPTDLTVTIEKNYISATSSAGELLSITYTTDGTKPNGYSGVSAGDIADGGKIKFLETNIQKTKLIFKGINTSNLFGGNLGETNAIIEVKGSKFIVAESFVNNDIGKQPLEAKFDQILSSFTFSEQTNTPATFQITHNATGKNLFISLPSGSSVKGATVTINGIGYMVYQARGEGPCVPGSDPTCTYTDTKAPPWGTLRIWTDHGNVFLINPQDATVDGIYINGITINKESSTKTFSSEEMNEWKTILDTVHSQ